MPKRYSVTVRGKSLPEPITIKGEFSDAEWKRLAAFIAYADELRGARLLNHTPKWSFAFIYDIKDGYTAAQFPEPIEVREIALLMRPFVLQKEQTYFYSVVSILSKHFRAKALQDLFQRWRDRYSGKDGHEIVRFEVNDLVLNSEAALNLWLNAVVYHRDEDKQQIMAQLKEVFPFAVAEGIFIELLSGQAEAVLLAASFIGEIDAAPAGRGRPSP